MKRVYGLLLAAVLLLLCVSCSANAEGPTEEHDAVITEAVEELKDCWEDLYKESKGKTDGYFEIKNTRVITVKENDIEIFDDVAYIVEFDLYTDYRGSAPYYEAVGIYDTVVVYKSGEMETVSSNLFRVYRSNTYQTDFSNIIQDIADYHGHYNCTEKLK